MSDTSSQDPEPDPVAAMVDEAVEEFLDAERLAGYGGVRPCPYGCREPCWCGGY